MNHIKEISLYFKQGSSDKEYHTQLIDKGDGDYVVDYQFGRRGSTLRGGTKTSTPVSLEQAEKIYTKLVNSKEGKGYTQGTQGNSFSPAVSENNKKKIHIFPQLLNVVLDAKEYINDDSYLAQEKKDGERRITKTTTDTIGINKKGQEVPLPTSII